MIKGFIDFKEAKIPFVIENCRMELFTDNDILNDFQKNIISKEAIFSTGSILPMVSKDKPQHFS